jgi:hypothetical protein
LKRIDATIAPVLECAKLNAFRRSTWRQTVCDFQRGGVGKTTGGRKAQG